MDPLLAVRVRKPRRTNSTPGNAFRAALNRTVPPALAAVLFGKRERLGPLTHLRAPTAAGAPPVQENSNAVAVDSLVARADLVEKAVTPVNASSPEEAPAPQPTTPPPSTTSPTKASAVDVALQDADVQDILDQMDERRETSGGCSPIAPLAASPEGDEGENGGHSAVAAATATASGAKSAETARADEDEEDEEEFDVDETRYFFNKLRETTGYCSEKISRFVQELWEELGEAETGLLLLGRDKMAAPAIQTTRKRRLFGEKEPELHQRVLGVLNKVTDDKTKYREIKNELMRLPLPEAEPASLDQVVKVFFAKAVREPRFSSHYADLVEEICRVPPNQRETGDRKESLSYRLRVALLHRCQQEFSHHSSLANLPTSDPDTGRKYTEEEMENFRIAEKKKLCGNVKFVGELFLRKIVSARIIQLILLKLLCGTDSPAVLNATTPPTYIPEAYDCDQVITLLTTTGEAFSKTEIGVQSLDGVMRIVDYFSRHHPVPRIQFLLLDLLEAAVRRFAKREPGQPHVHLPHKRPDPVPMQQHHHHQQQLFNAPPPPPPPPSHVASGAAPVDIRDAAPLNKDRQPPSSITIARRPAPAADPAVTTTPLREPSAQPPQFAVPQDSVGRPSLVTPIKQPLQSTATTATTASSPKVSSPSGGKSGMIPAPRSAGSTGFVSSSPNTAGKGATPAAFGGAPPPPQQQQQQMGAPGAGGASPQPRFQPLSPQPSAASPASGASPVPPTAAAAPAAATAPSAGAGRAAAALSTPPVAASGKLASTVELIGPMMTKLTASANYAAAAADIASNFASVLGVVEVWAQRSLCLIKAEQERLQFANLVITLVQRGLAQKDALRETVLKALENCIAAQVYEGGFRLWKYWAQLIGGDRGGVVLDANMHNQAFLTVLKMTGNGTSAGVDKAVARGFLTDVSTVEQQLAHTAGPRFHSEDSPYTRFRPLNVLTNFNASTSKQANFVVDIVGHPSVAKAKDVELQTFVGLVKGKPSKDELRELYVTDDRMRNVYTPAEVLSAIYHAEYVAEGKSYIEENIDLLLFVVDHAQRHLRELALVLELYYSSKGITAVQRSMQEGQRWISRLKFNAVVTEETHIKAHRILEHDDEVDIAIGCVQDGTSQVVRSLQ